MEAITLDTKHKQTPNNYVKQTFPVLGMTCAACAVSVESMLKSVKGVHDAGVNYANQTAWADYDDSVTTTALQNAVRAIGYDLVVDVEDPQQVQQEAQLAHYNELKNRTIWASVLSLPIVVIGMFFMEGSARALPHGNWIMMALAAPVVFVLGRSFFTNAFKQARHGRANMDTLVALSTGIAFFFSTFNTVYPEFWHARGLHAHVYFEAAAVVIAFISLGKLMEEKAKSNTGSALKKLMGLQPNTVSIINNGNDQTEIPISQVNVGNILLVKPGDKIPVDGLVTTGESYV